MAEYIKREAAIEAAIDAADEWDGGHNTERAAMIRESLNRIPAADLRESVRGKWIYDCDKTMSDGWTYKQRHCSVCGRSTVECVDYCQFCGANMQEGEKGDEWYSKLIEDINALPAAAAWENDKEKYYRKELIKLQRGLRDENEREKN
ncbi:MAG: hypothetical protein IKU30_03395 [Clostridia bacterium]|nr:hypothetical protein [Clostridia bacterium]